MTKKICVSCNGVIEDNVWDTVGDNQFCHGDPIDCFNEFRDQLATKEQAYKDVYNLWQADEQKLRDIRMIIVSDDGDAHV